MSKHFSHILIGLIFITVLVSACQPQPTATPETVDPIRFDGGVVSSPTVVDGVVYFGSLDGKLYAVAK